MQLKRYHYWNNRRPKHPQSQASSSRSTVPAFFTVICNWELDKNVIFLHYISSSNTWKDDESPFSRKGVANSLLILKISLVAASCECIYLDVSFGFVPFIRIFLFDQPLCHSFDFKSSVSPLFFTTIYELGNPSDSRFIIKINLPL